MFIILYGPEGSGKTTQGKLLAKKFKLPHLVSGDLVRKYAKEDTGIMGRICKESIRKGHYVPDSEMYVLWKQRLKENDVENGFIIDGFPRNMSQALFLDDKLNKYHHDVFMVIYLKVREKESVQRLLDRGRKNPDGSLSDSPENIRERLRRYHYEEKDVLDFYKKAGVLYGVNGEKTIEEIHESISQKIKRVKESNHQE